MEEAETETGTKAGQAPMITALVIQNHSFIHQIKQEMTQNVLIEPDVLVPDQPEASVGHLDAPVPRLLQLPGDSGELVPQSFVSENQPQSGSNPPNICRGDISEFFTDGPFELKNTEMKILS